MLGPLHICYGVDFDAPVGLPKVGVGVFLTLLSDPSYVMFPDPTMPER